MMTAALTKMRGTEKTREKSRTKGKISVSNRVELVQKTFRQFLSSLPPPLPLMTVRVEWTMFNNWAFGPGCSPNPRWVLSDAQPTIKQENQVTFFSAFMGFRQWFMQGWFQILQLIHMSRGSDQRWWGVRIGILFILAGHLSLAKTSQGRKKKLSPNNIHSAPFSPTIATDACTK